MTKRHLSAGIAFTLAMILASPLTGHCAEGTSPAEMVAVQQKAMARLNELEGHWEGTGSLREGGLEMPLTVELLSGKMLDGAMQLIEIRTRDSKGKVQLHGVNSIVYNTFRHEYAIQAHAGGLYGDFSFRVTRDGYVWQLGNDDQGLRYTGVVRGGTWTEVTEKLGPGGVVERISEFTLKRISRSEWPRSCVAH